MKKIIISTLLSLGIITSLNVSADNTIGMSLGESETIGTSSLSKVFGDVNCDGVCNILDTIALKNYLIEGKENQFYNYDINQNGSIDKFDLYNLNQIVTGEVETLEDISLYYRINDDEIMEYYNEHKDDSLNGWKTFKWFDVKARRYDTNLIFDLKSIGLNDKIVHCFSHNCEVYDADGNYCYFEIDLQIRVYDTSVPNLLKVYYTILNTPSDINIQSIRVEEVGGIS
ncbi:MAG: dockerin type I repeat-containing protein [Oscillospiraceae bacterium]